MSFDQKGRRLVDLRIPEILLGPLHELIGSGTTEITPRQVDAIEDYPELLRAILGPQFDFVSIDQVDGRTVWRLVVPSVVEA